jgi:hypothetical protein
VLRVSLLLGTGLSDLGIAADLFDKLKAGSDAPLARSRTGTRQDRSTREGNGVKSKHLTFENGGGQRLPLGTPSD